MRTIKKAEYTVGAHYLSALINDDYSGLDKEDTEKLNQFMRLVASDCKNYESYTYSTDFEIEPFFHRCEICGLYADCVTLTVTYLGED